MFKKILFVVYLGAVVGVGCMVTYLYGTFQGQLAATDHVGLLDDESSDLNAMQWHVFAPEDSTEVAYRSDQGLTIVSHNNTWSLYQRGYITGYNETVIAWQNGFFAPSLSSVTEDSPTIEDSSTAE